MRRGLNSVAAPTTAGYRHFGVRAAKAGPSACVRDGRLRRGGVASPFGAEQVLLAHRDDQLLGVAVGLGTRGEAHADGAGTVVMWWKSWSDSATSRAYASVTCGSRRTGASR